MSGKIEISRELAERWARMAEVFDDGGDGADPETARTLAQEIRQVIAAPVVERQPVAVLPKPHKVEEWSQWSENAYEVGLAEGWNSCLEWVTRGGGLPHEIDAVTGVCAVCGLGKIRLTTECYGSQVMVTGTPEDYTERFDFSNGEWISREIDKVKELNQ